MADTPTQSPLQFPYPDSKDRLQGYDYYERLFLGEHFEAFNIKIDSEAFSKAYSKLRYVMVNFAGLTSKVIADFLFSEPIKPIVKDGDQAFMDALVYENKLDVQNYESALSNSYMGDALYKIRIGKRNANDKKSTIIIEDITPRIYFPYIDRFNVRQRPDKEELAWEFTEGNNKYVRIEQHTPGLITNKIYQLNGNKLAAEIIDPSTIGIKDWKPTEETKIDRSLIVHVPNWKTGNRYFGISDYFDLDTLFFAINNRMTKTDNILDKHSDPILAVPEGILDEEGKVTRESLNMVEIPDGVQGSKAKPEYIVWNANLESAFKEVDKLVEFMFMISETSPDILGMGQGVSDSGRALKLKILRTIAKAARKKLYYDRAIKEVLYTAQLLAKAWDVEVGGLKLTKAPVVPEIIWQDGLPIDASEQADLETKLIEAGIQSKKQAIMDIDGIDEDMAEKKIKEIKEEDKVELPKADITPAPFAKMAMDKSNMENTEAANKIMEKNAPVPKE